MSTIVSNSENNSNQRVDTLVPELNDRSFWFKVIGGGATIFSGGQVVWNLCHQISDRSTYDYLQRCLDDQYQCAQMMNDPSRMDKFISGVSDFFIRVGGNLKRMVENTSQSSPAAYNALNESAPTGPNPENLQGLCQQCQTPQELSKLLKTELEDSYRTHVSYSMKIMSVMGIISTCLQFGFLLFEWDSLSNIGDNCDDIYRIELNDLERDMRTLTDTYNRYTRTPNDIPLFRRLTTNIMNTNVKANNLRTAIILDRERALQSQKVAKQTMITSALNLVTSGISSYFNWGYMDNTAKALSRVNLVFSGLTGLGAYLMSSRCSNLINQLENMERRVNVCIQSLEVTREAIGRMENDRN